MQNKLKPLAAITLLIFFICFYGCSKQGDAVSILPETPEPASISLLQDTIPIVLPITLARKESIGAIVTTAIEGKLPDSAKKKNNLIIRVTGDSARIYKGIEVLVNYTDSVGNTFSNTVTDTSNKVIITKLEKKKNGLVAGNFTLSLSNITKTKTYQIKNGKFSCAFLD
jgi:hypothetical protein